MFGTEVSASSKCHHRRSVYLLFCAGLSAVRHDSPMAHGDEQPLPRGNSRHARLLPRVLTVFPQPASAGASTAISIVGRISGPRSRVVPCCWATHKPCLTSKSTRCATRSRTTWSTEFTSGRDSARTAISSPTRPSSRSDQACSSISSDACLQKSNSGSHAQRSSRP